MAITASYIPGPEQTDAQAQARAQALAIGLAPRTVPPCYRPFLTTTLPGVVAEYGQTNVVFLHDDGTLTAAQVTAAIQPLADQQTADQQTAATRQTVQAALSGDFAAMATIIGQINATQAASTTVSAAQMQSALKAIAQAIRHQLRIDLALFDAAT